MWSCSIASIGKTLLVLLPVRFSLLVQLEPNLPFLPVISIGAEPVRLLLQVNSFLEVARLGVGGGEGFEAVRFIVPICARRRWSEHVIWEVCPFARIRDRL